MFLSYRAAPETGTQSLKVPSDRPLQYSRSPVAEVRGLPHGADELVDIVGLPLIVRTQGLLHGHGNHLLKEICNKQTKTRMMGPTSQVMNANVMMTRFRFFHNFHT